MSERKTETVSDGGSPAVERRRASVDRRKLTERRGSACEEGFDATVAARSGRGRGGEKARRPGARAASRMRGNGARRARASRAVASGGAARALPRGSGGGEKHIRRRGARRARGRPRARERGPRAARHADRAARDAPELRHGERLVCAETTVCAFARGRRGARGDRLSLAADRLSVWCFGPTRGTGDSEKTTV